MEINPQGILLERKQIQNKNNQTKHEGREVVKKKGYAGNNYKVMFSKTGIWQYLLTYVLWQAGKCGLLHRAIYVGARELRTLKAKKVRRE